MRNRRSLSRFAILALALSISPAVAAERAAPRAIEVSVDPRVELMSTIFRLAGNPEYRMCRLPEYEQDFDDHFAAFEDHPVVAMARDLVREHGVSFDAPMSLAVHLTDARTLDLRVPLDPRPRDLDSRWEPDDVREFLARARDFAAATDFHDFLERHADLSQSAVAEAQAVLSQRLDLGWFGEFFGGEPRGEFRLVIGLLNGPCNYGPRFESAGESEIYCIHGASKESPEGVPMLDPAAIPTIVHEFCHSYANAVADNHAGELRAPASALFSRVEEEMRRSAYGSWETMMRESLVRASVIRYLLAHEGELAAAQQIRDDRNTGFLWAGPLADLLGEYERERETYPTLESFAPRIIAFFESHAEAGGPEAPSRPPSPRRLAPQLLVSGLLMMLVGLAAVIAARRRMGSGMRWFAFGGLLWLVGVALKFACAAALNRPLLLALAKALPRSGYLAAGSLYVGALSGAFEIGVTLAAALIWRSLSREARRAVAVGVGAGSLEAILLGLGAAVGALLVLTGGPGSEEVRRELAGASATPAIWLLGSVERIMAILVHTASRTLVLLAAAARRWSLFWYGLLLLTAVDAIAGYIHISELIGTLNLWWAELALAPIAVLSLWALRACIQVWPSQAEPAPAAPGGD